jgi:hypothetical protein
MALKIILLQLAKYSSWIAYRCTGIKFTIVSNGGNSFVSMDAAVESTAAFFK